MNNKGCPEVISLCDNTIDPLCGSHECRKNETSMMHLTSEKDKMTTQINTFILAWSSNIFCSQSSNSLFKSPKGHLPAMQSKQTRKCMRKVWCYYLWRCEQIQIFFFTFDDDFELKCIGSLINGRWKIKGEFL